MSAELARQRYLQRHIEPDLPACPTLAAPWRHVLVIPAYRESASLLQNLAALPAGNGPSLVILVLNRPDSDPDQHANAPLRRAMADLAPTSPPRGRLLIRTLNDHTDLYLHDLDDLVGPLPAARGVGLARKAGCDLAFRWIHEGGIDSQWICSTDADAKLPADYFLRLDALATGTRCPDKALPLPVAAVYPFRHVPDTDRASHSATLLYELRLHHYVLGLAHAESPYAFHTLGSCLAVKADSYAQVRGFPRRAGGEDFYLLNKLAKLGPVIQLRGGCIELRSRSSSRVPFGTGPAVDRIRLALAAADASTPATATGLKGLPQFYDPACFEALRCFLAAVPALRQSAATDLARELENQLQAQGLAPALAQACCQTALAMGLDRALAHCRRQGKSAGQFLRQFHQWFDAFRTLKFIHGMRDAGWPLQDLQSLQVFQPQLWPEAGSRGEVEPNLSAILRHWGWEA
jgi:hypothetical protein